MTKNQECGVKFLTLLILGQALWINDAILVFYTYLHCITTSTIIIWELINLF